MSAIPLGVLTCVTGVSGSGKSTLVIDTLYQSPPQRLYRSKGTGRPGSGDQRGPHIDKVINIDQIPYRPDPPLQSRHLHRALYHLFGSFLPRPPRPGPGATSPGRFSFNVRGGRCPACNGDGMMKIEMHFLPDVYVTCEVCQGSRYNRDTLEIIYKGMNIAQVLDLTVDQALDLFEAVPAAFGKNWKP